MKDVLDKLNEPLFNVQYEERDGAFIAINVTQHECQNDPDLLDIYDIPLPSLLHVKAHAAAMQNLEENGELTIEGDTIEHDGKQYTIKVIGGPSGEIVLHLYHRGKFVTRCDTGILL